MSDAPDGFSYDEALARIVELEAEPAEAKSLHDRIRKVLAETSTEQENSLRAQLAEKEAENKDNVGRFRDAIATAEHAEAALAFIQRQLTEQDILGQNMWREELKKRMETEAALAGCVEDVDNRVAGALYDFMGWLTTRSTKLTLSDTDNCTPAVDAIVDFAKMRGLNLENAKVNEWQVPSIPDSAKRDAEILETAKLFVSAKLCKLGKDWLMDTEGCLEALIKAVRARESAK